MVEKGDVAGADDSDGVQGMTQERSCEKQRIDLSRGGIGPVGRQHSLVNRIGTRLEALLGSDIRSRESDPHE
jgi:hypothetical protein